MELMFCDRGLFMRQHASWAAVTAKQKTQCLGEHLQTGFRVVFYFFKNRLPES